MDTNKVSNLFKYLKHIYGEESVRLLKIFGFFCQENGRS